MSHKAWSPSRVMNYEVWSSHWVISYKVQSLNRLMSHKALGPRGLSLNWVIDRLSVMRFEVQVSYWVICWETGGYKLLFFTSHINLAENERRHQASLCWWIKWRKNGILGIFCVLFAPYSTLSNYETFHQFSRWFNNHKLADLQHTGISYWETSQTADSGIILNKRLNKEGKIYLREDDTHLVFLVSQHKPCCVIAGSHQHRPSSPRSPRSVPSSRIIYHQHTRTLLFTQEASHDCVSRHFVDIVFVLLLFFFPVISAVTSHISHRSESRRWSGCRIHYSSVNSALNYTGILGNQSCVWHREQSYTH